MRKPGINLKSTNRHFTIVLAAILLLNSCGPGGGDGDRPDVAKGYVVYGGTMSISGNDKYQSLYPAAIQDVGSFYVASQIHRGLVRFDPSNIEEVLPSIASSWEVEEKGLRYTFKLNQDVRFHDDACFSGGTGRLITAQDVIYSFETLCTKDENNLNFSNTFQDKLKGATAFYEGEATSISGLTAPDDYTIVLELEEPSTTLLYTLASPTTSIIAKEAVEMYGADLKVGTGAFIFGAEDAENETLSLVRNNNYFEVDSFGNKLPYLDTVLFVYGGSETTKLVSFKAGELHYMNDVPADKIKSFVSDNAEDFTASPPRFLLNISPEMTTHYYEFNLTREIFKDSLVRQAISYAVDRSRIVDRVLKNEAFGVGVYGITPPSFKDYNITTIDGFSFDPEKAKSLLAKAGYVNGKNFPPIKIEVNSGGSRNYKVAMEIQKQLADVLNINVEVEFVSFGKKLEDATNGNFDIVRAAWVADYPTPESFLSLFYGKFLPDSLHFPSYPNVTRYNNPIFDEYFEKGKRETDRKKQHEYFLKAEQEMIKDAPVFVLWYSEDYRLINSSVRNFYTNPINALDLTEVYLKDRDSEIKSVAD